jgi:hypothetical protein
VTVDQKTQNNFDTATAESKFGQKHFFVADNPAMQGMSAIIKDYYDGISMQRSVILADIAEFEKPLVIDVYNITADNEHQYDLPVHYSGQIIRTDFDYKTATKLRPLGEDNGYQHLWNVASGEVESSSLVTWLQGSSYYSFITSAVEDSQVIFARTGANDPDFNLRSEPALILRQSGKNHVFASVLETHGYFNESTEASLNARGLVKSVNVMGHDEIGTVIRIETISGNDYYFAISNQAEAQQNQEHTVKFDSHYYTWTGAFAQVEQVEIDPASK